MKLQVEDLRHDFGGTPALASTTLDVEEGEFVSIVGPSGCGKSTLFNIVVGADRAERRARAPRRPRRHRDDGPRRLHAAEGSAAALADGDARTSCSARHCTGASRGRDREEAVALAERYGLGEFVDHYPARALGRHAPARRADAHARLSQGRDAARRAVRRARLPDAAPDAAVAARRLAATIDGRSSSSPTTSTRRSSSPTACS